MVTTVQKKKKKKGTCCFCEISFLAGNVLSVANSLPRLEHFLAFPPKCQSHSTLTKPSGKKPTNKKAKKLFIIDDENFLSNIFVLPPPNFFLIK